MYGEPIRDVEHLNEVIKRHIDELRTNIELLKVVMYSVTTRIDQCIDAEGGHFEQKR